MKVYWRGRADSWGQAKGYNVHNENMLAASKRAGLEFADTPEEADVVFQIATPPAAEYVEGKPNVLFTMYEMDSIPHGWRDIVSQADLVIVPCRHNRTVFKQYTDAPVEVCQEGIDPELFPYHERTFPDPGKYFNFLWVGATNPRKGYELVLMAWELWIRNMPPQVIDQTQLIMKTQRSDGPGEIRKATIRPPHLRGLPLAGSFILDTRRVDMDELQTIYRGAHAFILPSFGEGWGLTLCEAQATGLPCIYTAWSGPQDFMKPTFGYPLSYELKEQKSVRPRRDGASEIDHIGRAAQAHPQEIYEKMVEIYENYETALQKGKRGSSYLHRRFTWDIAGQKLVEILRKHFDQANRGAA